MSNKNKIIAGVAGVIVLVLVFFGGVKFGQAKAGRMAMAGFQARQGANGGQGGLNSRSGGQIGQQNAGQPRIRFTTTTTGEILSKDDKSITVKLGSGGSRIIFFGASTTVSRADPAAIGDLATGKTVSVQGTNNPDGSVTAQMIQLR